MKLTLKQKREIVRMFKRSQYFSIHEIAFRIERKYGGECWLFEIESVLRDYMNGKFKLEKSKALDKKAIRRGDER